MLIYPPIPEIQLFKKLTLKIQGQGHGWRQSSKSQSESNISNILSTHIPLVPCQMAIPFLRYSIFKVWPWKSKVKVIAQGHKVGITPYLLLSLSFHVNRPSHSWDTAISKFENSRSSHKWGQSWKSQRGSDIQSTHIHFVPCESGIPFLSCDFFKICSWKSRAKVMHQVTLRSHNVSLRSYRLTSLSFRVNRASHSWVTTLSKFDLENQVSRLWVRSHFKVTMWV